VLAGAARSAGARLEVEDATGGARLRIDPAQINQLLLNLAQNALAACEGTARPARVRLVARRHGAQAMLEVDDNGAGIAADRLERIFDLFYSTRKGGTGLGLAIVQRIAQNHGGRLEVDSRPGEGTTMTVVLPEAVIGAPVAHEPVAVERAALP
jgi:signal transduction histidine kinase